MRYVVILFLLLVPVVATAQDDVSESDVEQNPYTMLRKLPTPEKINVDGTDKVCTDADGWRSVMLLAIDYQGLFFWRMKIQGVLEAHDEVISAYELKINIYQNQIKLLEEDRTYHQTRIGELETTLLTGTKSHRIEKGLMWGVILLETIAIGVLGVASFAQAN